MSGGAVSLRALLDALPDKRTAGALPDAVAGIAYDSRAVRPGELFVAVPGLRQDGRRFVADALGRGAAAVVLQGGDDPGVAAPRILVPSSREALARLADAYYGHPSRRLRLVGITGTSGKTTTSYLVEALLRTGDAPAGVIGTIAYRIGAEAVPAGQTTPEAVELQGLLARMVERGVGAAVMEVSSHALDLHRVDGIEFDVAVFTNLGRDHLDYHATAEAYRRAKARLFALLAAGTKRGRAAVVNVDDPAGPSMVAGLDLAVIGFGMGAGAAVRPRQWTSDTRGIRMTVDTPAGAVEIASAMVGEHNVMNLLGAVAVGVALGLPPGTIGRALGGVEVVPGRFERVEAGQRFLVVVDYAHKPEALEHVLRTARKFAASGRLGGRVRLRRRPGPRQAPLDGRDRGAPGRRRLGHLRQPAQRAARRHRRRGTGRHPGGRPLGGPGAGGGGPPRRDPRRHRVGPSRRRADHRGQGPRTLPGHRHPDPPLRRPRRSARRHRGARSGR